MNTTMFMKWRFTNMPTVTMMATMTMMTMTPKIIHTSINTIRSFMPIIICLIRIIGIRTQASRAAQTTA